MMSVSYLKSSRLESLVLAALLVLMAGGYGLTVAWAKTNPPARQADVMNVAVSPVMQLILAGGDPYLAANMGTFRALIISVEQLDAAGFAVLSKVQQDVSLLNAANEDNYYLAQAVLPWVGDVVAANNIVSRAAEARKRDFLPLFFLGFNQMYFERDFISAARSIEMSAGRVDGQLRENLLNLSAKFYERADDPQLALNFVKSIQSSARDPALKAFLQARVVRLEGLMALQSAAKRYQSRTGKVPESLGVLVRAGDVRALPIDPLGFGYFLSPAGVPELVRKAPPSLPPIRPRP